MNFSRWTMERDTDSSHACNSWSFPASNRLIDSSICGDNVVVPGKNGRLTQQCLTIAEVLVVCQLPGNLNISPWHQMLIRCLGACVILCLLLKHISCSENQRSLLGTVWFSQSLEMFWVICADEFQLWEHKWMLAPLIFMIASILASCWAAFAYPLWAYDRPMGAMPLWWL